MRGISEPATILTSDQVAMHSVTSLMPDFLMGRFSEGAVLSGMAELGDPTFFLVVVLTAYCPFQGLRSMRGAMLQRLCILLGSAGAISLHIALADIRTKDQDGKVAVIIGAISVGILFLTSLRALYSLWANTEEEDRLRAKGAKGAKDDTSSFASNSSGAATSFYGQEHIRKSLLPLAFVTTLVYICVGLPGGRWDQLVLIQHAHTEKDPKTSFLVGTGVGFSAATTLAIVLGTILQSAAREQRMRFMITCSLFALALWQGSWVFTNFHDHILEKAIKP